MDEKRKSLTEKEDFVSIELRSMLNNFPGWTIEHVYLLFHFMFSSPWNNF